jgi:hypothetical protein
MRILWTLAPLLVAASASDALGWGSKGHALGSRAAAESLPQGTSDVLSKHVDALVYDGDEPDRWRSRAAPELDRAQAPDHYIDLECWGDPDTLPPDRWAFFKALVASDVKSKFQVEPELVGFAPYRVIELEEQLEGELAASLRLSGAERDAAEELARTTAGLLGHFVLDLSNPHHTTIHHNGWKGENPHGYTTDRGFHMRFETSFVERAVTLADVTSATAAIAPRKVDDVRAFVITSLKASHAQLETLYELDKEGAFAKGNEESDAGRRGRLFAASRIAAGAADLRDLWSSAVERARARFEREEQARVATHELEKAGLRGRVSVRRDLSFELSGWGDPSDATARDQALEAVKKALPEGSVIHAELRAPRPAPSPPPSPAPSAEEPKKEKPAEEEKPKSKVVGPY